MKIVIGLGNPGPKYEITRHNVGFLAVDRLIDKWHAHPASSDSQSEVYSANLSGEKILLVKPQTFMNLSGRAVTPLFKFYKAAPEDLIVIHDDLDLKPLTIRLKVGGGNGGHNGLKSIDSMLGADLLNYNRIRIGIGRPLPGSHLSASDWVLDPFTDDELATLDPLLDQVSRACEKILNGNVVAAMNEFNKTSKSEN